MKLCFFVLFLSLCDGAFALSGSHGFKRAKIASTTKNPTVAVELSSYGKVVANGVIDKPAKSASKQQDTTLEMSSNGEIVVRQIPHILHVGSKRDHAMVYVEGWQSKNPGWTIDVLTDERIRNLASSRFPDAMPFLQPGALDFGVELSDLGRLLALEAEGGVYVDDDVQDLLPIDQWPAHFHYQQNDIDLILGMEMVKPNPAEPFQLTNWAMIAKPRSPILRRAIHEVIKAASSIPDVKDNIVKRFGPAALTSAVLDIVKANDKSLETPADLLTGNGQLLNFGAEGNVLILPYRAFSVPGWPGPNQDETLPTEDVLVFHHFAGSWKL